MPPFAAYLYCHAAIYLFEEYYKNAIPSILCSRSKCSLPIQMACASAIVTAMMCNHPWRGLIISNIQQGNVEHVWGVTTTCAVNTKLPGGWSAARLVRVSTLSRVRSLTTLSFTEQLSSVAA